MEKLYDEWSDSGRVPRTSHALLAGGRVWLIDPVDVADLDERVRALGEPGAVLQLLDRHNRDCASIALRLGVEPRRAWESVGDAPFDVRPVRANRFWREVALWDAESSTLVSPDALGTVPAFRAPGERLGWHPLVRPLPPRSAFARIEPERILVGHGPALTEDASGALSDLLANGRGRLFSAWRAAVTSR